MTITFKRCVIGLLGIALATAGYWFYANLTMPLVRYSNDNLTFSVGQVVK